MMFGIQKRCLWVEKQMDKTKEEILPYNWIIHSDVPNKANEPQQTVYSETCL